ncbi:hypothetical protein QOZ80_2BG0190940 [Eleusine coracana subsp. coracana]|nr:hypothetical protein QOZ80_2BG0190940 [Eleusine coracana subsp. coracana]
MRNHIYRPRVEEREPPNLPVDILQAIFSRANLITLLRCAAASKPLRRIITDPVFHDQLRRNADSRFVPSLLVGIFFPHSRDEARRFLRLPPSGNKLIKLLSMPAPVNNGDYYHSSTYRPVASRAGLVVLRPRRVIRGRGDDLCVGSPVTGRYVFLPTATLYGYWHVVILSGGDGHDYSFHFELLVMDGEARTQTTSSRTGAWGPVTEHLSNSCRLLSRRPALVLRGAAHWLCEDRQTHATIHVGGNGGQATTIEVPPRCLRRRRREVLGELLLLRSVDGRLGLLVAEAFAMAVWTLSEDSRSWARRVVVDRARLLQPLTLRYSPLACLNFELEWLGETSGTVVLQLQGAPGILLLQLQTGIVSLHGNSSQSIVMYLKVIFCSDSACPKSGFIRHVIINSRSLGRH